MFEAIKKTIKQFPEVFALPVIWIGLIICKSLLELDLNANAIIPYDWIQFPVMAGATVMFANALAHGAIKYNQPSIWAQYKKWINNQGPEPDNYFSYLVLYTAAFVIIMYVLLK